MADSEVKLRITSDASGAVAGMDRVRGSMKGMGSESATIMGTIKSHWVGVSVAIGSAAVAFSKVREYMLQGAKAMQAEEAFKNAAASIGADANKLIEDMKRVTNATIDDSDMMQKAFKAISGGMKSEDIVSVAEIARLEARRTGEDVGTAFSNIIDAIETGKTKALRAYHLITTDQKKIADAAKEVGIEVDFMRIALMNYAIQAEHAGSVMENQVERFQKMEAAVKGFKEEIGKLISWLQGYAIAAFLEIGKNIVSPFALMERAMAKMTGGLFKGTFWQDIFAEQDRLAKKFMGEGGEPGTRPAAGAADKARAEMKKYFDDLKKQTEALKGAKAAQDLIDQLALAQLEWKKAIDAMNPSLDEENKQLEQLIERAGILKEKWTQKGTDTSWIDTELERGKEYIKLARGMKETEENIRLSDEASKIMAEWLQRELDLKLRLIDIDTQRANMALDYSGRALSIQSRYGQVTPGQAASSAFDMDVRRLEITRQQLALQIQARSEKALLEDEETGVLDLLLRQKAVDEEINMLLGLRSAMLKEHTGTMGEGFGVGWNKYFDDMGSQFQRGEGYAKDIAQAMHGAFEDFFFDPMNMSWDNLWKSMQRVAAKAMSDITMDLIRQLAKVGLQSFSSLMAGSGGQNMALGNTVDLFSFHTGGIVGGIPRLHRGLMPGEYPAILQRGEGVFTPAQMKALGGSKVTVNIINNAGAEVTTQSKNTSGGMELDVIIDRAVASKLGQFGSSSNKVMRQNFNTSQRLINR